MLELQFSASQAMSYIDVLLKIIINQYFVSSRCAFVINDETSVQVNLPIKLSVVSIKVAFNVNSTILSEKLFQNYGCQLFILNTANPAFVFSLVEQEVKIQNETFSNRSYIFVDPRNNIDGFGSELFKTKEIHFISNLLIISLEKQEQSSITPILEKSNETFVLWTHRYRGCKTQLELNLIDKWFSLNQSFLNLNDLLPNKMTGDFGRTYRVGFFPYLPYIFYDWNKQTNSIILDGIEGNIINEFFKKHKLSMKPYLVKKDYWGDVFDNGSVYGLRGLVYENKVDIGMAANFATERMFRYYGLAGPLQHIGITCLVPAPKLMAGWLTPMHVYSKLLWEAILMGYIFIIVSIYIAQYASQFKTLSTNKYFLQLNKFGEILFTICTQYFGRNGILEGYPGTIFVTVTLFMTFFLGRTYESGLASIMTIPSYEESIETANDFLDSNISWGGIQVADYITNWKTDEEEKYRRAYRRYLAAPSEVKLKKLLAAGNFGLLIERITGDHFHFPFPSLEKSREIKLMQEDLHREYSVFLLRKSSYLIPPLNKFISSIREAGIIIYWIDQASAKVLPLRDQKEVKYLSQHYRTANQTLVQLRLAHVAGVFGIVVAGNLIALMVFFAELIYSTKCQCKYNH